MADTPNWSGQVCAVIASGPSLAWDNFADVELIRQAGIKTIAVNNSWQKALFADVIYAGDTAWWRYNHKEITIPAQRWTCSKGAVNLYGCRYRARYVKPGYNSGANAIEVAANVFGAAVVLLVGFDCSVKHGTHHHKDHKHTSNPTRDRAERWKPQFKSLLKRVGPARIINCSRYTELTCFPRQDLRSALCEHGLICDTPTTNAPSCLNKGLSATATA